jgi:hypothetical protein
MKTCGVMDDLVQKYLEGSISERELAELKAHAKLCSSCGEELRRCHVLEEVVREALLPEKSVAQARAVILDKLAAAPARQNGSAGQVLVWGGWLRRWLGDRDTVSGWAARAFAAGALLLMGLGLGLWLGRSGPVERAGGSPGRAVPMKIADLQGVVLVRSEGTGSWHRLHTNATVHLGDTFYSTAKSRFTLRLNGQSMIAVSPNSMLVLQINNSQTAFFLEEGQCRAALESPHPPFFIYTPHGRVEALGTEFTVTVE